jgi:hypothetical protein
MQGEEQESVPYLIEPDECHEEPDVSLRQHIARNVALLGEDLLGPVKRLEEGSHSLQKVHKQSEPSLQIVD